MTPIYIDKDSIILPHHSDVGRILGGQDDLQGPTSCPDRRCTNAKSPARGQICENRCGICFEP